jgi:hypothetical protein
MLARTSLATRIYKWTRCTVCGGTTETNAATRLNSASVDVRGMGAIYFHISIGPNDE